MSPVIRTLAGLSLAIAMTQTLSACASPTGENEALRNTHEKIVRDFEGGSHISAASLSDMAPKEYVLFDVREPDEFDVSHIKGAIRINYFRFKFKKKLWKLDRSRPYLVHCKSGHRSSGAVKVMKREGFTQIYHLDGGFDAWKASNGQP